MILFLFIIYYIVGVVACLYASAKEFGEITLGYLLMVLFMFWLIWPFVLSLSGELVIWRSKK